MLSLKGSLKVSLDLRALTPAPQTLALKLLYVARREQTQFLQTFKGSRLWELIVAVPFAEKLHTLKLGTVLQFAARQTKWPLLTGTRQRRHCSLKLQARAFLIFLIRTLFALVLTRPTLSLVTPRMLRMAQNLPPVQGSDLLRATLAHMLIVRQAILFLLPQPLATMP